MRNPTGYFFDASKLGGLINQNWIAAPAAPATVRLSGLSNVTSFSHASFSWVRAGGAPVRPMRKISAGAVRDVFENTTKSGPICGAEIVPPCATNWGAPPATGTRYRLSVPWLVAVNTIELPSGESVKSLTERSGV